MEVVTLEKDGRCLWLQNKVLVGLAPKVVHSAANPYSKKLILVKDWISNDAGRVGVDVKWLDSLSASGIPVVDSIQELPADTSEFQVVNTGYDSIVGEERLLRKKGVEMVDKPCPFIRNVRTIFEKADPAFQYVYLCEDTHITVKNFGSIFPADMILVQTNNYKERIVAQQNGKPFKLIPYVTYLRSDSAEVLSYINEQFPGRAAELVQTSCMWISSKASPIIEISDLGSDKLGGIKDALLITTAGSTNKSLISMVSALCQKGLNVVQIGSFKDFLRYERQHTQDKVLLVRSPIPNGAEGPIMAYIQGGWLRAWKYLFMHWTPVHRLKYFLILRALRLKYMLFPKQAIAQARAAGLLKKRYLTAGSLER